MRTRLERFWSGCFGVICDRETVLTVEYLPRSRHYVDYGKSPLVFIVTDSRSRQLNIGYTLFGDANRQKYGIDAIAFNACSSTLLKRGLKRIAAIMAQPCFAKFYTTVAADVVDSIVLSSQGDLRNAMINMHMAAQKSE